MTDYSSQDVDRLTAEISRLGGSLSNFTSRMNEKKAAEQTLSRDLRKKSESAAEALGALTGSARGASQYFTRILGGTAIGAAFSKLITAGNEVTSTYRDLANVGQNFQGSLIGMLSSAGDAGLSLDDFKDSVMASSRVVSRMGMRDFVQLRHSINETMVQHGMYAMTTAQITKQLGDYGETVLRSGLINRESGAQLGKGFTDLMGETAGLSAATGIAKDSIQQMSQSAIQHSTAMARITTMSTSQAVTAHNQLQQSMAVFAANGSEAANFMTKLRADSFGMGNTAFTDGGKELISVGLGNLGTMMENTSMTGEDAVRVQQQFRDQLTASIPLLQAQAAGGSAAATHLLQVQGELSKMTVQEFRDAQKRADQQSSITKLFTTFGHAWELVTGQFRAGFFKVIQPVFDGFGDFTKSGYVQSLQVWAKTFGERLGEWVKWFLSPQNLKRMADVVHGVVDFLTGMFRIGAKVVGFLGDIISVIPWASVASGVGLFVGVIGTLIKWAGKIVSWFSKIPGAVEAVTAGLLGLLVLRKLRGLFSSNMVVNARTVIVNGGGSGGSGGDLGGDLDEGGGGGGEGSRRGRGRAGSTGRMGNAGMSRAERIARINERRVARGRSPMSRSAIRSMGRGAERSVEHSLLKSVGRRIPLVGGLLNLGLGAAEIAGSSSGRERNEAIGGTAGGAAGAWAGAEGGALAGAAIGSIIPGVGTAIGGVVGGLLGGVLGGMGGDYLGRSAGGAVSGGGSRRAGGGARMAMTAAGAGLAGYAASSLMNNGDEEAPTTRDNDPIVQKLSALIMATNEVRDNMIRTQQALAALQVTANTHLQKIETNTKSN